MSAGGRKYWKFYISIVKFIMRDIFGMHTDKIYLRVLYRG